MSSDRPSDARSPEADRPPASGFELSRAALIRSRGTALLAGLERHRPGSGDHADGTAAYAFAAAVELDLGREHAEAVREAARLHEVGMVYVPAEVLAKPPGELTSSERSLLDSHAATGAELARGAGIPEQACEWIGAASERFDGSGPAGLAGDRIPIESRIVRVACAFDTLLAAPAQAPPVASPQGRQQAAFDQLRRAAGTELDPRVIAALAALLERAAPGT
jgi:HD-GYP domain-containing protein (c-di-GMP phosphodiesterase class II)